MIQRIQTLYLIMGTISIVFAFLHIPFFYCEGGTDSLYILNNYYSLCFVLLLAVLTVVSFKNRKQQIKLIYLLSFLLSVIVLWNLYNYYDDLFSGIESEGKVCVFNMIIVPFFLVGKLLFYLSIRAIKKDDALIDSLNRLR